MIVQNSGGKDFEPDPLLDTARDYEARVLGVFHAGKHQKQKHDGTKFIEEYDEIEQAIIEFEIVEEGTQVERGPEDNRRLENRRMAMFLKYSSHEKSTLFKIAQSINPKAAYLEKKEGVVDTSLIIGRPVSLELKLNKDGDKTNIKAVNKIPPKYQDSVGPLTNDVFQYSVMMGAFPVEGVETSVSDVPKWMLEFALNKAIDAEQFAKLEEIEAHLESLKSDDDNSELEGDRLPPKTEDKAEEKADEPVEEEKEPKDEPKVEEKQEETKTERRSRRSRRGAAEEKVDYSTYTIEQLESLVVEKGLMSEEELDDLSDNVTSDEEYTASIIEKLEA